MVDPASEWVKSSDMAKALGILPVTLQQWRVKYTRDGFFEEGVHFVRTGPNPNSMYLWNKSEIVKVLAQWKAPTSGGSK